MVEEMTIEELTEEECTEENEVGEYPELDELFGRGEEDEYDEEEFPGPKFSGMPMYGPMKTVTEIAQPIKTIVEVGAKEIANGEIKPSCSFSIERNLTDDMDEFEVIENDFDALIERVKGVMESFKEE